MLTVRIASNLLVFLYVYILKLFQYNLHMTTKKRFRNKYRLEVRERDHAPAHVHLFGGGYDVIIDLVTLEATGSWSRDLRDEVMVYINAHREELIEEWKKWHD